MFPECNKDEVQDLLQGLYKLTREYKEILNSKEYKRGRSFNVYVKLIRHAEILKLIKRIQGRKGTYNNILNSSYGEFPCVDEYITDHKIAVYTSIFGKYDLLREPVVKPNNVDYFIVTDQQVSKDSLWKAIDSRDVIPKNITSPIERNRYAKMLPHRIFKDYEYSIYVDGNVFITSDLSILIKSLDSFPIAMHRYKNRDCVYEEIEACISKGKDRKDRLIRHKELLIANGVPKHGGLLEATVIARKHSDEQCIELMENWWNEFLNYSQRDQISLIDCLWKANIDINEVAMLGDNIMNNDNFVIIPHL